MLQHYLISIDARLRSRNPTVSVKAETAECGCTRQLSRDANTCIKESRLFMYIFNICKVELNVFFKKKKKQIHFIYTELYQSHTRNGCCQHRRVPSVNNLYVSAIHDSIPGKGRILYLFLSLIY